jgi:hypothetical protein
MVEIVSTPIPATTSAASDRETRHIALACLATAASTCHLPGMGPVSLAHRCCCSPQPQGTRPAEWQCRQVPSDYSCLPWHSCCVISLPLLLLHCLLAHLSHTVASAHHSPITHTPDSERLTILQRKHYLLPLAIEPIGNLPRSAVSDSQTHTLLPPVQRHHAKAWFMNIRAASQRPQPHQVLPESPLAVCIIGFSSTPC